MAEILDEASNAHGRITGLVPQIDGDHFVVLRVELQRIETEQTVIVKYGPELDGSDDIAVSSLSQHYNERLVPGSGAAAWFSRVISSDIHLDLNRGGEMAAVIRDVVEDFYAAEIERRALYPAAA